MGEEEVIYLQSLDQTVARFMSVLVLKGSHGYVPVPSSREVTVSAGGRGGL